MSRMLRYASSNRRRTRPAAQEHMHRTAQRVEDSTEEEVDSARGAGAADQRVGTPETQEEGHRRRSSRLAELPRRQYDSPDTESTSEEEKEKDEDYHAPALRESSVASSEIGRPSGAKRTRRWRESLDEGRVANYREMNARQHQQARRDESDEHGQRRRCADRENTRQRRRAARAQEPETITHYLGPMNVTCSRCGAIFFAGEVRGAPNNINACCKAGRVEVEAAKFNDYPVELNNLFTALTPQGSNFRENIRNFNSAMALASMGAQIEPPPGRPLLPDENRPRLYGQIYILDTAQAAAERMNKPANSNCDPQVVYDLGAIMTKVNRFVKSYKMMSEVVAAEEEKARREGRSAEPVKMVFDMGKDKDRRRYNHPTADEVAVVYVGDEEGDVPDARTFVVHSRSDGLKNMSHLDPKVDPFVYPIFFPTGQLGWEDNSDKKPSGGSKRVRVTQREYYTYLLQVRRGLFNPILHGKALFQQFAVDAFMKIEQNRLFWHRSNQGKLRADSYKNLQDFTSEAGDALLGGPPGKRIILPSSFQGSPRAMAQDYQASLIVEKGK